MHFNLPYKAKQFFFVAIKLSIVAAAFFFIYSKLAENESLSFSEFVYYLKNNGTFSLQHVSILVFLSLLNWSLEILKWQHLVKLVKPISFLNALEQSLAGLTASMITPNRIGDYGAKIMFYSAKFRPKLILLNLTGHMAQMLMTTVFGSIGLVIFINRYDIDVNYYRVVRFLFVIILVVVIAGIGIGRKTYKIKGYSLQKIGSFFKSIPFKTGVSCIGFSLFRYLVFSYQYYYLLQIFGVEVDYLVAMTLITSMYLLASILPAISIFDVLIKGSVAVFLFSFVEVNELTILSITTTMWLLNFVIPSLFGSYYVINFKLPVIKE